MKIPKIHESEYRFCLILWEHEPVTAVELVKLCQEQLGWKRTTTYTVIKRLGERGILKNENGQITSLISKEEAQACEIDELIEKAKHIYFDTYDHIKLYDYNKTMSEMVKYFTKEYNKKKLSEYKPLDLSEIEKRIAEKNAYK